MFVRKTLSQAWLAVLFISCQALTAPVPGQMPYEALTSSETIKYSVKMAVKVALVDLRQRAEPAPPQYNDDDPLQETQLVYGEKVLAYENKDGWIHVEAIEQPEFTHNKRWEGYPGWVPQEALLAVREFPSVNATVSHPWAKVKTKPSVFSNSLMKLPLGSRIFLVQKHGAANTNWAQVQLLDGQSGWMKKSHITHILSGTPNATQSLTRQKIIATGRKMLGTPYYWGGRSTGNSKKHSGGNNIITGIDCSGLINLCYRSQGIDIPRDAHEQFLKSRRIEGSKLDVADLIFLAKPEKPDQIVHVMLYAGKGKLLEASARKRHVRIISMKKHLDKMKKDMFIHFGTFFE